MRLHNVLNRPPTFKPKGPKRLPMQCQAAMQCADAGPERKTRINLNLGDLNTCWPYSAKKYVCTRTFFLQITDNNQGKKLKIICHVVGLMYSSNLGSNQNSKCVDLTDL